MRELDCKTLRDTARSGLNVAELARATGHQPAWFYPHWHRLHAAGLPRPLPGYENPKFPAAETLAWVESPAGRAALVKGKPFKRTPMTILEAAP